MILRQINVRWESSKDLIQSDPSYCRRKTTRHGQDVTKHKSVYSTKDRQAVMKN